MTKTLRSSIKGALNRSIKGGLLKPAQFRGSTLDLDFAGAKSLKNQIGKEDVVSFTRASSGTYVGSDGLIKSATTDTPRFDYDSATGESLGLLIEESRTNKINNSKLDTGGSGFWQSFASEGQTATWTANSIASPDGTVSAGLAEKDGGGNPRFINSVDIVGADTVLTASVFCKQYQTEDTVLFAFYNIAGVSYSQATININTAAATLGTGYSNVVVEEFNNSWKRVSVKYTVPSSATGTTATFSLQPSSNGSGMYFWGAQVEVGSFLTSLIITSGSTATRAADVAEITGADFAKTNLLQYSNTAFGSAIGTNVANAVESILTPQNTVGRVRKLIPLDNTTTKVWRMGDTVSGTANTTYTGSIWVKTVDGGTTDFLLDVVDNGVTTFTATGEWQRVSTSGSQSSQSWRFMDVQLNADTDALYLWGSQIEEGSVLTDYTPSVESFVSRASTATYVDSSGLIQTAAVDEARYENGELLLEEARTNLILNDVAQWATTGTTVTADTSVTSPDGLTNALKVAETAGTSFHFTSQTVSIGAEAVSFSGFFKAAERTEVSLFVSQSGNVGGTFNLSNGTVSSVNGAGNTAQIKDYGNGWYRCTVINDGAADINDGFRIAPGSLSEYEGIAGSGIYFWGVQLERGSYPTSYIITTTTTVTRAADVSTSALGVDSFYNQDEGTIFMEARCGGISGGGTVSFAGQLSDGTSNNYIDAFRYQPLGRVGINSGGSSVALLDPFTTINSFHKSATAAAVNNFAVSVDGASPLTDNAGAMPVGINNLRIGDDGTGTSRFLNGHVKRLAYFNTRLPDATLQSITS